MRESAQAALTLVKAQAASLHVEAGLIEKSDIHIHVPAGATPKDGPSAGVAMFMALASLLTGRTIRSDTAMTGEISLRGLVLPVGGIKEKVVAAAGAGLKRVMLPARNRRDYDDIPEEVRQSLEFIWLERVEDAVSQALQPAELSWTDNRHRPSLVGLVISDERLLGRHERQAKVLRHRLECDRPGMDIEATPQIDVVQEGFPPALVSEH